MDDCEMYNVPTGYNIKASVYALDADLKLSQDKPQKDGQEPEHPVAPAQVQELQVSSGTNRASTVATASASADPNSAQTPVAIRVAEPNRVTPVANPVANPVATTTPEANRANTPPLEKTVPINPVVTPTLEKTVPTGATDDPPQWTPGLVRYAAMRLVAENWERLAVHVECAGDTPVAKLAQFKRGMSKHGVTEVHPDQPRCLFIFFFFL